ncbi:CRISPR-associated endonuclease Cas4/Cas1 [Thermomonas hydrothermalis]|uniref:CRISPR-associated endonuclease Cas1 n=1 Tax=Thermomonas hydrothermalis TaxID=213588 RepID=A0A1M4STA5_9GAMM|nr:CRISPR-associated endonuclease Cas4/Cas1 [Thermomonas hydrothermalis]MCL6619766.1 CRISPR-associated endonuclease Cas4/Cas1 [Thermomonas hydrothermalis]SHE35405.1 CRISP-associated protein Cas1 [Thermomonas hydrothermalis]
MDESLWPARNVAEYAYCPRLFYYMQVEGIFLPSSDTEQGVAVHRRVDKPSAAPKNDEATATDPKHPKAVRSLTLTSKTLGLTATLDLAEIAGQVAIPVEYRKGRSKHIMPPSPDDPGQADAPPASIKEAWPTDRVQIGLQAILLEENGYTVTEAVIYYAEEKLRLKIDVDANLKAEALATLEAAKECAKGPRPLPLVHDPRCVRCSLQPICLPDEINHQRAQEPTDELRPRKIWPPRDEGIHIIAQQNGTKIGIQGMALKVTNSQGETVKTIPLASVESLSLLGSVQMSTQALHALANRGIPIAFLSASGRMIAMVDPLDSASAQVRRAQIRKLDQPEICLDFARALVAAKIMNQRTLLMRNHASLPPTVPTDLAREAERAATAESLDAVRGHEGQAAAIYFAHFSGMFKGPLASEFNSNGRQRRPPPDPINACLSLAYSMLTHECVAALRVARLEPSIGGFHTSKPGRPALALDLMEPFRPLIADSVAISTFNRGELTEGHFLRTAAGCALTDAGRKAFFSAYGRRMDTEVTHPVFKYRLSYRRMIVLHARMIAAWLAGEIPSLAFLMTR